VTDRSASKTGGLVARTRRAAARYAEQLETTTLGRMWSRLLEMEFVDRSIALAAKAFVSFLPLLVIVSALSPDNVRDNILTVFSKRFGVSGAAFDTVTHAFTSPEQTKTAAGIGGTLITIAFAVSFTTALQRVYLRPGAGRPAAAPVTRHAAPPGSARSWCC
jgi:membrane protein